MLDRWCIYIKRSSRMFRHVADNEADARDGAAGQAEGRRSNVGKLALTEHRTEDAATASLAANRPTRAANLGDDVAGGTLQSCTETWTRLRGSAGPHAL